MLLKTSFNNRFKDRLVHQELKIAGKNCQDEKKKEEEGNLDQKVVD